MRRWPRHLPDLALAVFRAVAQLLVVRLLERAMLIESPADETEEQFRAAVSELIVSIYNRMPDWLEFRVGRRFEFDGRYFREFVCAAGSVCGHIHLRAQQAGGISRAIIERAGLPDSEQTCWQVRSGVETKFDCEDLRAA